MQEQWNSSVLQAENGKRESNKNANIGWPEIRRNALNIKQNERILIKAVKEAELKIDNEGKIWRMKSRGGKRNGEVIVRSIVPRRAEHITPLGYMQVRSMWNGKRIHCLAHRLVWQHFFGDIPDGIYINHKNGIKHDNRPENLELVTASENMKHAFCTGLRNQFGEKNPACKVPNETVVKIRELYATGKYKQSEIAELMGVNFQYVSSVVRGNTRNKQFGKTSQVNRRCFSKRDQITGKFLPGKRENPLLR